MAIYFDNGATSYPKPEPVYEAINQYMRLNGVSSGRGNYRRAMETSRLVYEARKAVGTLLGVKSPSKIIFTPNITESLNLVLKGFLNPGDKVLTSKFEHNAMWRPLKLLEQEKALEITQIDCDPKGNLDYNSLIAGLEKSPNLLCFAHGSNVLGNLLDLEKITALAHTYNVPVLVDTAQTAGVVPIKAAEWGVDFLAFTGHKSLLGPMGTGGLYIHGDTVLGTLKEGGTGSSSSSPFQPQNPPDRYESGTMNIPGIMGLKAAADYLTNLGVGEVHRHELSLISRLIANMESIPEITLYGPGATEPRIGLVSFNIGNHDPYHVATWLDEHYGIMVRAGLHCSPQAHSLIGTENRGAVRISLNIFNTIEEIDLCSQALRDFVKTGGV